MKKEPLSEEAQRIYIVIARYNRSTLLDYLHSQKCGDLCLYTPGDIACFERILNPEISNEFAFRIYCDMDTAARETMINIIELVFNTH